MDHLLPTGIAATVEPRFNDLWYNNIPGITINICLPSKSYSTMYGTELRYNNLWYNNIPYYFNIGMSLTERKIFPVTPCYGKINITDHKKC